MAQSKIKPKKNAHRKSTHPGNLSAYQLVVCDHAIASHRHQLEHAKRSGGDAVKHQKIIDQVIQKKHEFLAYLIDQYGMKLASETVEKSQSKIAELFNFNKFNKLKNYYPKAVDLTQINTTNSKSNVLVQRQQKGHGIGSTSFSHSLSHSIRTVKNCTKRIPVLQKELSQNPTASRKEAILREIKVCKFLIKKHTFRRELLLKRISEIATGNDPFCVEELRRNREKFKALKRNRRKLLKDKKAKNLVKKTNEKKSLTKTNSSKKVLVKSKNQLTSQELAQAKKLIATHQSTFKQVIGKPLFKQETMAQFAKAFTKLDNRSQRRVAMLVGNLKKRSDGFKKKWGTVFSSEKTLKNEKRLNQYASKFTNSVKSFTAHRESIKGKIVKLMQPREQQIAILNPFLQNKRSIHRFDQNRWMLNRNRFRRNMSHKRQHDLFSNDNSKRSFFVS